MKARWIGATWGILSGGILGALAGYCFGGLLDMFFLATKNVETNNRYTDARGNGGDVSRDEFWFSFLVLSAYVIAADGKVMHSEMKKVRQFLRKNGGEVAVAQGEEILKKLFEYKKKQSVEEWESQMDKACAEIGASMNSNYLLQIMSFLAEVVKADNRIEVSEVEALKHIARAFYLDESIVDQLLHLGNDSLEDAYNLLGIKPDASDEEVRRAYRKMALQFHPDKVATLGDDVKEAAKIKFQQINAAKELIDKSRGK